MDLVVDLVSNMLDNWGCGNMVSSWGSNMVGNWSSNSKTMGSISSSWDNSSMGNGGNWCNSWSRGIDTSYQAMAVSKVLSISISSRSSKTAGSKREDNKALHIVWCW